MDDVSKVKWQKDRGSHTGRLVWERWETKAPTELGLWRRLWGMALGCWSLAPGFKLYCETKATCWTCLSLSYIIWKVEIKILIKGLPWWHSGWESACQCRGCGFEPWSGKIPHAAEQLGPWATITEPARLEPVLRNKRGRDSERPAHRDEEWPQQTRIALKK